MFQEDQTIKDLSKEAPKLAQESPADVVDEQTERIQQLLNRTGKFKTEKILTMEEAGFSEPDVQTAFKDYQEQVGRLLGGSELMKQALSRNERIAGMQEDLKRNIYQRLFHSLQGESPASLALRIRNQVNVQVKKDEDAKMAELRSSIGGVTRKSKPAMDVTESVEFLRILQEQARGQFEGSGPASSSSVKMAAEAGRIKVPDMVIEQDVAKSPGLDVSEGGPAMFNLQDMERQANQKRQEALRKAGKDEGLPIV